jgi:hypothetical protein
VDAWRALAATARSDGTERNIEALTTAAEAWDSATSTLASLVEPGVMRTPGEHARLLDEGLFGAAGITRVDVAGYESLGVEIDALRLELASIRAVDEALPSDAITFRTFVDGLEARMQRPSTLLREAGGVLLAPMPRTSSGAPRSAVPTPEPRCGDRGSMPAADRRLPPTTSRSQQRLRGASKTFPLQRSRSERRPSASLPLG